MNKTSLMSVKSTVFQLHIKWIVMRTLMVIVSLTAQAL